MSIRRSKFLLPAFCLVFVICSTNTTFAQRELAGAAQARLALERLNVCATVLMIAAHPDDENTAVLAYLARGRLVETGYNQSELGKIILAACFINDIGTVLALGLVFANYNFYLLLFVAATAAPKLQIASKRAVHAGERAPAFILCEARCGSARRLCSPGRP